MFRSVLLSGTALVLAIVSAAPAAMAQSDKTIVLPVITVTAKPDGSLTVPGIEEQRSNVLRTPGSVGFVDSEALKGTYANNLRDVLKDVPGVYAQTRYGQELRVSIRGSGIARAFHTRGIELLLDGSPLNLADGSGDFYQVDPLGLRSAEVLKGGNALPFGTSTFGGAINFVTPTAHTAIAPNIFRMYGGSFGTSQGNFQLSRVLGDADFLINGTVSHSDGFRAHMRQQYEQFNGNIGYRISPNVETRFFFGAYITDQKLPGTLSLAQALASPGIASAGALAGDQARNVRTERIANRTTVTLDSGKLDFDTWLIHKSLYHPIFQVIDQDGYTYGVAPRYSGTFQLGGARDELIVGGRVFAGDNRARQFVNIGGSRGAQTVDTRQNAWSAELYLENRVFVLPTLAAVAGAKLFHAERQFTNLLVPLSNHRDYDGVNPKVGLLWEPRKEIQVFANITRGQDIPDFSDLTQAQANGATSFVPLRAQQAWTLEAGTRGHLDRLTWDVTIYQAWVDNQLLQFTTNPNVPASTFNAGRTILRGIELGLALEVLRDVAAVEDKLTVSALWNYSDFSFRHDSQYRDNKIAGVPPHVVRTILTYTHPIGFYVAPAVDWVPTGAWIDYANTARVPGYVLLGVQAGMNFKNGMSVFLDARNLTNQRYISDFGTVARYSVAGTQTFYSGDGRSVYVGARVIF